MKALTRKAGTFLVLLALVTVLFAVAGCGGDDVAPVVHVHEGEPFEIRITAWYGHSLHGAAPLEAPDPEEAADYEMARMQYDNVRAVEERYNVRIIHNDLGMEYVDFWELFLAQQLAGEPLGEVVVLGGHSTVTAMRGGHLTDISTLRFEGSDLFGDRTFINATYEDGDSIWQVNTRTGGDIWGALWLGVNMDLINRLGLPNPVELYEAGDWNWVNFLDIMRTATAQGYFGISGVTNDIGAGLMASNDATMIVGDWLYGFDQPRAMEALELFSILFEERLWKYDRYGAIPIGGDPDDGDWWREMTSYADGDTVFWSTLLWVEGMVGGHPDLNYVVMPFPQGPNGTGNTWSGGIPQAVVIPAGVENPGLILEVLEALMAWPGEDTWMIYEATMNNARNYLRTEGCVERLVDLASSRRLTDGGFDVHMFRYVFSSFAYDVFHGARTIAESVEYNRGPSQERIDNMLAGVGDENGEYED